MLLNPLTVHSPKTLDEATKLYSSLANVRIQAGGTFLLNSLKLLKRNGAKTPENIISLRKVAGLSGIEASADSFKIKAMTTITELFESDQLTDNLKVLHTVCRNISTTPIRNMASFGGNLTCRYTWTEMPAVVVALDATMHFINVNGQEESIAAEEFFKNNAKTDKIFTHVTIKRDKSATIAYQRVKKTVHVDIPMLSLCIKTNIQNNKFTNTRVGVNNCVAFAQRDKILEDFLNGKECKTPIATEALDHLDLNIYDNRSNDYKRHMFRVSIKNALLDIIKGQK